MFDVRFARTWPAKTLPLALGLVLAACSDEPAPNVQVHLDPRLSPETFESGRVELVSPAGQQLAIEGWHLPTEPRPEGFMVWASQAEASVWLPSSDGAGSALQLALMSPCELPFAFSVEPELNGVALGSFELGTEPGALDLDLPSGLVHEGLNRLVLRSSHVVSPAELGLGKDARELGVRFGGAELVGAGRAQGRFVRIRVPDRGVLSASSEAGGRLVVQDFETCRGLAAATGPGPLSLDLGDEAGRDVLVSTWGPVTDVQFGGSWRPANLVLIVCDTLRDDILADVETPNLDALAKEGIRFSESFSHAPMTLPSHTALFSSRYPHVNGVVNNGQEVPADLPLLSDWMLRSGYESRAVASLGTLWLQEAGQSLDRGFESFQHVRGDDTIGSESVGLMGEVISKLSVDSPFFLFAHFADPHEPYRDTTASEYEGTLSLDGQQLGTFNPRAGPHLDHQLELDAGTHRLVIDSPDMEMQVRTVHLWRGGPRKFWVKRTLSGGELMKGTHHMVAEFTLDKPETISLEVWVADTPKVKEIPARYRQEVARADAAVGGLVAELKQAGLWENSLVVFTSDHGEGIGSHGRYGHVQNLYDELIHVPLIIKPPAGERWTDLRAGLESRRDRLVRHVDLVPTMLDLLGLEGLPGQMGTSILEDSPRILVTETHAPEAKRDLYAVRDERFKLIYSPEEQRFSMFDLVADPGELQDVFSERGAELADWQELLSGMAQRWSEHGGTAVDASEVERLKAMGYF